MEEKINANQKLCNCPSPVDGRARQGGKHYQEYKGEKYSEVDKGYKIKGWRR